MPMFTRRTFLKSSILAAPLLSVSGLAAACKSDKQQKPIVISTWSHGLAANEAAWTILAKEGRALDAVEAGVRVSEADEAVNSVGYGGLPDRDGKVTLDACIMDELGNAGSVAFLQNIMHPISVARKVMENTPHVMLVGEGAYRFAIQNGFKPENMLSPAAEKAWKEWLVKAQYNPDLNIPNRIIDEKDHDTIGMLAMDAKGALSGACTTSGLAYKLHGRVGDSPIIGAGLFVDNEVGAATATGLGETVIKICGAHTIVEAMRYGKSPMEACKIAVERLVKKIPNAKSLQVGFLALNTQGEYGAFALNKGFEYALTLPNGKTELMKSEYWFKD